MSIKLEYLRILLLPFSLIYFSIITFRAWVYQIGIFKKIFKVEPYKSKIPVICVGNIRVGGTGKSQIVLTIAKNLIEKNKNVVILSRGYKRKSKGFLEVEDLNPEKFGDEPVLLKKNLPNAKVFVSEDRKLALQKINELSDVEFILMDDGLQNMSVQKDFTIVLIDRNYFEGNLLEHLLLPAGNLREPKNNIFNYDSLIFNHKFHKISLKTINHKDFYETEYLYNSFMDFEGNEYNFEVLKDNRIGAFCGIAQPESFQKLFEKLQIFPVFFKFFPDHHFYDIQDLKILIKFVESFGCYHLITTEKDIVRLIKFKDEFKRAGVFLYYTKITASITNEENLIKKILCLEEKLR